jgi:urease accessory protein UreH
MVRKLQRQRQSREAATNDESIELQHGARIEWLYK